jgi:NitT/TauT family transport system substrate-binding protein
MLESWPNQAHDMIRGAFLWLFLVFAPGAVLADAYTDRYDLAPREDRFDLGVQPLGYPTGVLGAVLRRDRIFRAELGRLGIGFSALPFRRGPDMVPYLGGGRLEAGLLGDMPTLAAALREPVWVVGLAKQTFTSVVSREAAQMAALRGQRVGYAEGSSAHYALLQGLTSAGLSEKDVELVPMGVDEMPDALAQGRIAAFAAWEPAPAVALERSVAHRVVFRSPSSDFLVVSRSFEARHPEAVRHLAAALARAVAWLRQNNANLERAVRWTLADGEQLSGRPGGLGMQQAIRIVRRELLDVPSAPKVPASAEGESPLQGQFRFLQQIGKIPSTAAWDRVAGAFAYRGLEEALAAPERYRIGVFDYDP